MNVVATDTGTLVEVQGTGEGATFPRSTLDKLLDAALAACEQLFVDSARGAGAAVSRGAARVGRAAEEGVRKLTRAVWSPAATARSWPNCAGCSTRAGVSG